MTRVLSWLEISVGGLLALLGIIALVTSIRDGVEFLVVFIFYAAVAFLGAALAAAGMLLRLKSPWRWLGQLPPALVWLLIWWFRSRPTH